MTTVRTSGSTIIIRVTGQGVAGTPGPGGAGETNTASNAGTGGVGQFDGKVGLDLEFRNNIAASSKVVIGLDGPNKNVTYDVAESALTVENLSTASTTTTDVLAPDGVGGLVMRPEAESVQTLLNSKTGLRDVASGLLSINGGDNTKFDIKDSQGQLIDFSTPTAPTRVDLSWSGLTAQTVTNLATNEFTIVYIEDTGGGVPGVVQSVVLPDGEDRRDKIFLGLLIHSGNTIIESVENVPVPCYDVGGTIDDLLFALGDFNISGNVYAPNGVNLLANKSAGSAFGRMINGEANVKNPHTKNTGVQTGITTYLYSFRDGVGGFNSNIEATMDPDQYDDGSGTLQTVTANRWTIQRIVFDPRTELTIVEYGQAQYTSKAHAIDGISENNIVKNPKLTTLILRGWLVVEHNATDLSDSSTAEFIEFFSELTQGSGFGTDTDAVHLSVPNEISTVPAATAAAADILIGEDADDSGNKKKFRADEIAASGPPALHASTHSLGGSDEVTLDNLRAASVTTTHALFASGGNAAAFRALSTSDVPDGADGTAIHDNVAGEITAIALVAADGADHLLIEDADDSNNKKRVTVTSVVASSPPAAHALGGAQHTADTIANLNSKVSDANLMAAPGVSVADEVVPRFDGDELTLQGSTVTIDDLGNMTGLESLCVDHTATEADDFAVQVKVDAAGFGDVKGIDMVYISGAIAPTENEEAILVGIDDTGSTGGRIVALEVLGLGNGSAEVDALECGVECHPVKQISGTFGDLDTILVLAVDETVDLSSGGAGNVSVFIADNDTMTFGDAAKFQELSFVVDTPASGSGIAPTFEYSTGVGTWSTFSPADATNGMRNSGVIAWLLTDIPGWVVGTGSEFLIRITRTRNSLATTPILDLVQRAAGVEYDWDKDGNITVRGVVASTRLRDEGDNTKEVKFDLSNITTATERTVTFPDRDITLGNHKSLLSFGDYSVGTTTTLRYLNPMQRDDGLAHTSELQFEVPFPGTVRNLRILHNSVGVGGATLTYTVRKNASDTSLIAAPLASAAGGSDTSNSFTVIAGDKLSLSAAKSASITASPLHIMATMELEAD